MKHSFLNLQAMKTSETDTKGKGSYRFLIQSLVLSLTLGLAPFVPEPHLFGKIRWVLGGAIGMQAGDYFDLILHGAPWLLLILALAMKLYDWRK
jgi:hypothetical protein